MRSFKDATGREWEIAGSLLTFQRIRSNCGVDMLTLPTTQECLKQIQDPYTLGRVLYEACAEQCERRGVSPEAFAGAFNADALTEATDALVGETIFFCRKDLRPALTMAFEKAKAADRRAVERMTTNLPRIGQMMDAELDRMAIPIGSATSSPESSVSSQPGGPSGISSGLPKDRKKRGGQGRAS
jgi:hypothetical protein